MPSFGKKSREKLKQLDPRLQAVLVEAIKYFDFTIICGHRTKDAQMEAFNSGASHVKWPNSKHNTKPSIAVDLAPWYPTAPHVRWEDEKMWFWFGGYIQGIAKQMGIELIWGRNWDSDMDWNDQTLMDCPHFELKD